MKKLSKDAGINQLDLDADSYNLLVKQTLKDKIFKSVLTLFFFFALMFFAYGFLVLIVKIFLNIPSLGVVILAFNFFLVWEGIKSLMCTDKD